KKKSITKEENSLLAPPLWQGLCPRTPFKKQCHSEGVRSTTEESRGTKDLVWRDSSPHKGVQNDGFFIKNIFRHPEPKAKDLPEWSLYSMRFFTLKGSE
ncbi:hypothetical protein IJE86_07440, partial [bacterium]|nr:hypothetical protein [bacterium]